MKVRDRRRMRGWDRKKACTTLNADSQHQTRKDNERYQKKKMPGIEENKQETMLLERSDKPREDVQLLTDNHPKL